MRLWAPRSPAPAARHGMAGRVLWNMWKSKWAFVDLFLGILMNSSFYCFFP